MFGGDEDFFDDDDFFQDVFQHESNALVTEKDSVKQSLETGASRHLLNNTTTQLQSGINTSSSSLIADATRGSVSNKLFGPGKQPGSNKYECDDSFEFGDDFPLDNLDEEILNGQNSNDLTTPPDSEFTAGKEKNSIEPDAKQTADKGDQNTDFRSKILKSLNAAKQCNNSLSDKPVNSHERSTNFSSIRQEKRKATIDTFDSDKINTPVIKKQCINDRLHENTPTSPPSVTSNSYSRLKHQNSSNLFNKDNNVKETPPFASPSTPFKPLPANRRTTRSPGGPIFQKRKFPGPAGILPALGSNTTEASVKNLQEKDSSLPVPQDVICSQNSATDFTRGPWQQMLSDLDLDPNDPNCPFRVFNIKWVLRRAGLRGQAAVRKVPFLAVMLKNLDVSHADATALLRDMSGSRNQEK